MKFIIMQFSPRSVFIRFRTRYPPQRFVLRSSQSVFLPQSERPSFAPIQYKWHVFFPLISSCQRNSPGLKCFETFRNMLDFLRWGVVSPTPDPQAGGQPRVGCPQLLILYIRSYPPYLEVFSSIRNLKMCHAVVIRNPS